MSLHGIGAKSLIHDEPMVLSCPTSYLFFMIVEIPTADDFKRASISLLNMAWQIAIESLRAYEQSNIIHSFDLSIREFVVNGIVHISGGPDTTWTPAERAAAEQQYWIRSQPALGNALSLIQQAIELGLKGRIAEVSPLLLIARDARDYPTGSTKHDVPFSAFRSLDAADLMRVHNTVCADRLDDSFGTFWDAIRRQRNVIIHSVVSSADSLRPQGLIEHILKVNRNLHPGQSWFERRLQHARNDELEAAYGLEPEKVYGSVLNGLDCAIRNLPSKVIREHFRLDLRARTYICLHCKTDCDGDTWYEFDGVRYAQLMPKGPASTTLHCAICSRNSIVVRQRCSDPSCKSNVISADPSTERICLLCDGEQPEEDDE